MAVHPDEALVRHVARLAKLSLTDADVPALTADLGRMLDLVAVLDEVDVTGVAPLLHPHAAFLELRPDVARGSLSQAAALLGAPAQDDGCFLTPRVVG